RNLQRILLLNIAPNMAKKEKWMMNRLALCGATGTPYEMTTYDVFANGYTDYSKLMPFNFGDLHFHPRYEGKCWNYMQDHLLSFRPYLNGNSLFWIIGSVPK